MSKYDIGFNQALNLALEIATPVGVETVSTSHIVGRVCAEDVTALIDYPESDVSLKDGFAVVSRDIAWAGTSNPVRLGLSGTIGAGDRSVLTVETGNTVRVLSGATIPHGADAVLAEEFASVGTDSVTVVACAEPGRNILFRGSEIRKGEVLARSGQVFTPSLVGLVVAGGLMEVSVFRRPRIGLLATGNEILLPGRPPEPGKLFASNLALQQAWLQSLGMETEVHGAGDSREDLSRAVLSILERCDVLLTSGGAWKGERDLIVKVLDDLGWKKIFHRVRIGPGKAVGMGILGDKPVFCLPGGPPSNEAAFLLIALPALFRMAGHARGPHQSLYGILDQEISGQEDWTQVIPCRVERKGSSIHLIPLERVRRLSSMAKTQGFVLIPEGTTAIGAGSPVTFICSTSDALH